MAIGGHSLIGNINIRAPPIVGLFFYINQNSMEIEIQNNLAEKVERLNYQIGNTPLVAIENLHANTNVKIYAKLEWQQISGSVKARAAYNIIKQAIEKGDLHKDKILLDATSGNTGIAYATIAKELGIKVALCLPQNISNTRKKIIENLGVEIIYTSKFGGTDEAQQTAKKIAESNPEKYFYANQYSNENNWLAHYNATALEVINKVPTISHFVTGLGTTGTFIGTSKRLKKFNNKIQLIALQPDLALHGLEGWKHLETATVPEIFDSTIANRTLQISSIDAYEMIKKMFTKNSMLLSPSSAANLVGAIEIANQIEEGTIVTIFPDNAIKYSEIISKIIIQ